MAIGGHTKPLLQVAHRIAQVEVEMTLKIVNLVAEIGEPALERDTLVA